MSHGSHRTQIAKLGDVCAISVGKTPSRSTQRYWDGALPWVTIADLNGGEVVETAERISATAVDECRCRVVPTGTLLFSFKLTIGKMAFAGRDLYTNEAIAALTPLDEEQLSSAYLRFALASMDRAVGASHAVKGRTLNQQGLAAIEIPLPPLPEQTRLASFLTEAISSVDSMRRVAEARERMAVALRSAFLREAFEGAGPADWSTYRLGDLVRRHNEVIHPGDRSVGSMTFVGLEHVESGTGRRLASGSVQLSKMTGRKPTFQRGQIVYGYLRPYLNKVWVAEFDGCSSVDQFAFAPVDGRADTEFVAAFMRSPTFLERSRIVTTTGQLPRIGIDEILAVEIQAPNVLEQRRIAAGLTVRLDKSEAMIAACREEIAAIDAIPGALLNSVILGRE